MAYSTVLVFLACFSVKFHLLRGPYMTNFEQAGLNAADVEIGDWLRKNYSHKTIILAVNKCESPRKGVMQASEFWSLG